MFEFILFLVFIWLSVPLPFVEETFLSPLGGLIILVENQLPIDVWIYFWILGTVSLICISVIIPISHYFYYHSFVISFKVGRSESC